MKFIAPFDGWCCYINIFTIDGDSNYLGIIHGPGANGRHLYIYKIDYNDGEEIPIFTLLNKEGLRNRSESYNIQECGIEVTSDDASNHTFYLTQTGFVENENNAHLCIQSISSEIISP